MDPMKNIGILLIEFFELYGKNLNYRDVSIGLDQGLPMYVGRDPYSRPTQISIIDPQDYANDVSLGSYNFLTIKGAFMRAFMVLTSMIGAGYERRKDTRVKAGARDMVTLLGSILTVSRTVLEQREFIQSQYEKYRRGELDEAIEVLVTPTLKKRKRQSSGVEVEYIDLSGSEAENLENTRLSFDNSKGNKTSKTKKGKRKTSASAIINITDSDNPEDKADITAYYSMGSGDINGRQSRADDGLIY